MSKRSNLPWYILLLIILLCGVVFMTTREGFKTNASSFPNDIKNNSKALVLFYSNNCGYCKDLKPEWESAVSQLPEGTIASVDCSPSASGTADPEVTKIMKEHGISGFPTMLFFNNGLVQEPYEGERNAAAIVAYVKEKTDVANNPQPVKSETKISLF